MENYPNRRSIRLKNYDYTQSGIYFVTICTSERKQTLGQVQNGDIVLNTLGKVIKEEIEVLTKRFPGLEVIAFCILPNHIHLLLDLPGKDTEGSYEQFGKPVPGSLATIIRSFKSKVSWKAGKQNYKPAQPIWQQRYYEHIVRNEDEFQKTFDYVVNNVQKWESDREFFNGN